METSVDLNRDEKHPDRARIWGRVLAAVLIIAIPAAGFLIARRGDIYGFSILWMLASFAVIGFFYLVCTCFGICRLTMSELRHATFIKMFNRMGQAIVITDQEGSIRYMNDRYRQLSGGKKRRPEVLFSIDEQAARTISRLIQELAKEQNVYGDIYLSRPLLPSNQPAPIYGVNISLNELEGETIYIWLIEDITHRRNVQEQQFAELTQAINHLDHAPAGFVAWNKDGKITYLNATLANWIGFDLAGNMSDGTNCLTLSRLIGAQCTADLQQFLQKLHPSHITSRLDLDLFHEDGRRFPIQFYPCSAKGEEELAGRGVLVRAPYTVPPHDHETTVLPDMAANLFADYFKFCPIALAIIDSQGLIQEYNQHWLMLFKLEEIRENQNIQLGSLMDEAEAIRLKQWLDQEVRCQEITPLDISLSRLDEGEEQTRHVRLLIRKLNVDALASFCIIAAVEIDEQRALEAHMEQGQKMQAVGQLAGGIAHDFNNVLTAVIMSCDLLLSNHRHSDPSYPDIMNIKHNAYRAATLVRQLLAFSRRQTLQPELLDVNAMLADVHLMLTRLVGSNITVKIEYGRDLWWVKADYSALERAITNLATNARDAMLKGGHLTLRSANIEAQEMDPHLVQHLENRDYVLIEVRDSGTGMTNSVREKIFEPFFTTKEVGRGTGLGLAMVYGIVTQTGGYIHCDSEPGQGTCFSLYLPRHIPTPQEDEVANARHDQNASAPPLRDLSGSATVLVVEDEDAVRRGSIKALQSRGYTVLEASNGIQALEIAQTQQGQIDLVISDVVMPEMDGPTLLKELRPLYPHVKFIFVSGYAEDAFAKNLPQDAHFAFLPKPFSLKQLALTVKEILEVA